jgi:hypothetical protein
LHNVVFDQHAGIASCWRQPYVECAAYRLA